MATCSLVEELKMKKKLFKKIGYMQTDLLISEFRIYASLTLRFAYKRVFVYMQLGYMQAILPVPSTCIYPSSTVNAVFISQLDQSQLPSLNMKHVS